MTTPDLETALDRLRLDESGPAVVAIGGGHGLAQVLEAVTGYASEVTGVVTVADDGGSSGRLTTALPIPPPGDVRKALLALSTEPTIWRELFGYRFETTDVSGHSLGNLMLAALTDLLGDFEAAVRTSALMLGAQGRVLPAASQSLHLQASIDGRVVDGQAEITQSRGHFDSLTLLPSDATANREAVEAIREADQIIIGPGSIYTSICSALLVPGIAEAVADARGRLVFVMNLVTQDAESLRLTGPEHVQALERIAKLPRTGTVLVHVGELEVPNPVERLQVTPAESQRLEWSLEEAPISDDEADWPQHDPIRLGQALRNLV